MSNAGEGVQIAYSGSQCSQASTGALGLNAGLKLLQSLLDVAISGDSYAAEITQSGFAVGSAAKIAKIGSVRNNRVDLRLDGTGYAINVVQLSGVKRSTVKDVKLSCSSVKVDVVNRQVLSMNSTTGNV